MYMCIYIKWTMSMAVRIGYNTCYIFLKLSVTHWSHFRGELFCVQHTVFWDPVELAKCKESYYVLYNLITVLTVWPWRSSPVH